MRYFLAIVFTVILAACAHQPPQPVQDPYVIHKVVYSGETLAIISRWYTGFSSNWQKLLPANPGLDPLKIRPGAIVRIPRELAVRVDALPASAVPGAKPSKNVTPASTPEPVAASAPVAEVATPAPTVEPTVEATAEPTAQPTAEPTAAPTAEATVAATPVPTVAETPAPAATQAAAPAAEAAPAAAADAPAAPSAGTASAQ